MGLSHSEGECHMLVNSGIINLQGTNESARALLNLLYRSFFVHTGCFEVISAVTQRSGSRQCS